MTRTGLALGAACTWLAQRPMLHASPVLLLNVVQHLVRTCNPHSPEECQAVGEAAVKEVAMPLQSVQIKHIWNGKVLNPEDLME